MDELKRRYGLFTAIAMVVGITIGSGVFFKADDVLIKTGGNLKLAIFAWMIGGAIMIVGGYTFSLVAGRVSKVNGLIDYVEAGYGEKVGYYVGWFQTIIYYPTLTGILAWVAGLYTDSLFNLEGQGIWYFAIAYLISIFTLNYLSPLLAGKFQISTTVFKLIPLGLVAIVGTIVGLSNGMTVENFSISGTIVAGETGLAFAVLSTAFAYEGWVIASSINAELLNPKKDLPKALFFGSLIVVIVYITYYIGLSSVIENQVFLTEGDNAVNIAVTQLFGNVAGTVLIVFVIVSCLGTLNGLMIGTSRGMYSLAFRNNGPKPELFKKVNSKSGAPQNSTIFGLIITSAWLLVWYGNFQGWYGAGHFLDTSELPIALLYTSYILVYIWVMRTFKDLNFVQRFIIPSLATLGALFIIYGAVKKDLFLVFMLFTVIIMLIGALFNKRK